jgi:hypothetical protein
MSRTKQMGEPACATAVRSVGATTGSSSAPAGTSSNSPTPQVEAAAARHQEQATALDSLIADAEQTALAMADRLGRGEKTLAEYDAVMGPLDTRLADLRAKREALNGAPGPVPAAQSRAGWAARWKNATHDEQRALLRTALRGRVLVVGPANPADRADVTRRLTLEPSQPVA